MWSPVGSGPGELVRKTAKIRGQSIGKDMFGMYELGVRASNKISVQVKFMRSIAIFAAPIADMRDWLLR
jgi:hypothetical protein